MRREFFEVAVWNLQPMEYATYNLPVSMPTVPYDGTAAWCVRDVFAVVEGGEGVWTMALYVGGTERVKTLWAAVGVAIDTVARDPGVERWVVGSSAEVTLRVTAPLGGSVSQASFRMTLERADGV